MAKKIVKRRKLRVFRLLLILVVIGGLFFGVYKYLELPISNLLVKGTLYLGDDYILDLAGVKDYPSFWLTSMRKVTRKLEKSPYIKRVKIKRSFYHVLTIEIEEKKALFEKNSGGLVLDDQSVIDDDGYLKSQVPRLINYVPDDKYESFVKGMGNINDDILEKISDIEYVPNDLDKDRFLLYMDDGNMVYLTLTKFKMINYYNDVLKQLEDRKGILYLDNGNHFQIKE